MIDPERPAVVREVVLDITLPSVKATARVEGRRIVMAPNVAAGAHAHNGPVFGVILSGSVVYQVRGGPAAVLRAGDVFYEAEDSAIERFDALEEGVSFIGYFLVGPDEETSMIAL